MPTFGCLPHFAVLEEERPLQLARRDDKRFGGFDAVVSAVGAFQCIGGRAAAFLGRSSLAMFAPEELLLEMYVVDPHFRVRGDTSTRRRRIVRLFL